jgi:hypothetical protein
MELNATPPSAGRTGAVTATDPVRMRAVAVVTRPRRVISDIGHLQ